MDGGTIIQKVECMLRLIFRTLKGVVNNYGQGGEGRNKGRGEIFGKT